MTRGRYLQLRLRLAMLQTPHSDLILRRIIGKFTIDTKLLGVTAISVPISPIFSFFSVPPNFQIPGGHIV